jgi:hypothetical protein
MRQVTITSLPLHRQEVYRLHHSRYKSLNNCIGSIPAIYRGIEKLVSVTSLPFLTVNNTVALVTVLYCTVRYCIGTKPI